MLALGQREEAFGGRTGQMRRRVSGDGPGARGGRAHEGSRLEQQREKRVERPPLRRLVARELCLRRGPVPLRSRAVGEYV